jgi:histidinol-phosphate phosphatase family protein
VGLVAGDFCREKCKAAKGRRDSAGTLWQFKEMSTKLNAEQIIDTLLVGGRLVFFAEQAPPEQQNLIKILSQPLGRWPFVLLSKKQVTEQGVQTHAGDMLLFFPSQQAFAAEVGALLQGQRLVLAPEQLPGLQDASFWEQAYANFLIRKPLQMIAGSFQSKCLFLDRDDVVVKNVPYNTDPSKVELMPGVVDLIHRAHRESYWVAIVTNQSGLGRGWISWQDYQAVQQRMFALLAAQGAWIDECVWASYYENPGIEEGRLYPNLRKPEAGMFQLVGQKLRVDFSKSVMVGDSATDLIAADMVNIPALYLLKSDKQEKEAQSLRVHTLQKASFHYKNISDFTEVQL